MTAPNLISAIETARYEFTATAVKIRDEVSAIRRAIVRAVYADGVCVGVAVAGNPARVWQGTGRIVISRVATTGERNACSKLYGAICRAAQALGYREAWTYTLPEEPGTSLRAAGFTHMGESAGGEHDRAKRPRKKARRADPKQRWCRVLGEATP